MLYKKFFTVFLCFIVSIQILAQTAAKTDVKKSAVSAELEEKAVALLNVLARDAEQFGLPRNRISARIEIAGLLWKPDEKQARVIYQNAVAELNTLINQIPSADSENEEENTEKYTALNDARTLRTDLLIALGSRDPKFALESLQALSRKDETGKSLFEDDQTLELKLAARIAEQDPKQAYELAKKNLEKGLDANLFSTLASLYGKDAELGTKLAQEIAAKIKSKDTNVSSVTMTIEGARPSMGEKTNQTASYSVNTWEIQSFLDSVKKLNRQAEKNKAKAVLSENEIKELVDILAQKYVRQQNLSAYEVVKIMPEITKYFPAQATALQRKIGQEQAAMLGNLTAAQDFQNETEGQTSEEITQFIERKPVGERDDLYQKAAETAFASGEIEEAKRFHDKIKNKREYDYFGKTIEGAMPLALAEKGDLSEARRMLAKVKTAEERIEILTALAASVAQKGDKKSAAALAGEARAMFSGRMKNRRNLASVLQIAQAYAAFDGEQGFAFLESNMSFFNDVISAGILLDEFNEMGSIENDEIRLDTVRGESYRNLSKGVALIKSLSASDFDRTVALAERFSRPEVRFYARFRVAESLLNPKAETDEKEFQSSYEGEHADY